MRMYENFDIDEKMELSLIIMIYERAVAFMREGVMEGYYPPRSKNDEDDIIPCFCNCQDILDGLTRNYSTNPAVARERLDTAVHGAAVLINQHFKMIGEHHIEMDYTLCERTIMYGIGRKRVVGFCVR